MKIITILSFFLLYTSFITKAQIGIQFPEIIVKTLDDREVNVPKDIKGKHAFIAVAFKRKAEADMTSWLPHVYYKFIAKTGMFDKLYDVNVYIIPMFSGTKKEVAELAKKKLKKETDETLFPYVLFYKGKLKKYTDALGIKDKKLPYFFLLDKNGKIIYHTSGRWTYKKMEKIEDLLPANSE